MGLLTARALKAVITFSRSGVQTQLDTLPSLYTGIRTIVTALNHVAIAVPNLEEAAAKYRNVLGAEITEPQTLPEHGVKVVFVKLQNTKLELLEPLNDDSPIANFLKKNPSGGMHHMCLEVGDIYKAIDTVGKTGVRLLNENPKIGAHGTPVVFMHPKDMCGVLTELEEVKQH